VAVALFAATVPGVLVRVRYSRRLFRWQWRQTRTERRTQYLHRLLTSREYAKEIRLFQLGALFIRRFQNLRRTLRREKLEIAARRTSAELGAQTLAVLAVFGSFLFIAQRTLAGAVTLGGMVMYYQAFQRGIGSLQSLLKGLADLYEDSLFLTHFHEFLRFEPRVKEPVQPVSVPDPIREGIEIRDLSFRYPDSDRDVLQGIRMTVNPGEHVALVGENGSGKTTLIKLLCRLYDPSSGGILVDGQDLRRMEIAAWRDRISVIFQDYAQYHATARDNIWFGNIQRAPDDGGVEAAARSSGSDEFIAKLPERYETVLGKMFEEGEELSIGEWQKMALARAFFGDYRILVLDEPSSSLDARAEYELYSRFHELSRGRTVFLISHRLSTASMADRIFVLDGGKLVESGTHEELLHRQGAYARMFELQARRYRSQ
jgi:ATP-binding cassette subfamily B protein